MKTDIFDKGKMFLSSKNVEQDDLVVFIDEGEETLSSKFVYPDKTMAGTPHPLAGQPKKQFEIGIKYNNKDYVLTLNKSSFNNIADAYGDDTKQWVGKEAKISLMMTPNGKKAILLQPII